MNDLDYFIIQRSIEGIEMEIIEGGHTSEDRCIELTSVTVAWPKIKHIDGVDVQIKCAHWQEIDDLTRPILHVQITNKSQKEFSFLPIKVFFYEMSNRKLWSYDSNYMISFLGDNLSPGECKMGLVKSSVGYHGMRPEEMLPALSAHIFIDDSFYGSVIIPGKYTEDNELYSLKALNNSSDYTFFRFYNGDFGLFVTENRWILNDKLYIPYLKIAILNQSQNVQTDIKIKAVFYTIDTKELWSEVTSNVVAYGSKLLPGFKTESFLRSSHGFVNQLSEENLPDIYAEIYVNETFYGYVIVNRTYDYKHVQDLIFKDTVAIEIKKSIIKRPPVPYRPIVISKHWEKSGSLYVPRLAISVVNLCREEAKNISLKVIYYDITNWNLWSVVSNDLVGKGDTPIRCGYRKTAFLYATTGFENKIDEGNLPRIIAELYINDTFYGSIDVDCSYQYCSYDLPVNKEHVANNYKFVRVNNMDFLPVVKQNCWVENTDIFAPYLRLDITNQQESPACEMNVTVKYTNETIHKEWGEATRKDLTSHVPLKHGYNVSAFLKGSYGYKKKINEDSLPTIKAHIFINDIPYGSVIINRSYNNDVVDEPIFTNTGEKEDSVENLINDFEGWNKESFLGKMGYSTSEHQSKRREILNAAIKKYGHHRVIEHINFLINMRIKQENGEAKYHRAISIWKEDMEYIRHIT